MEGKLAPFKILGTTPPGTCQECGTAHQKCSPHNQQSLIYQYKFYDKNGRWPTWEDAMAHCSEETKKLWEKELTARGISINNNKEEAKCQNNQ